MTPGQTLFETQLPGQATFTAWADLPTTTREHYERAAAKVVASSQPSRWTPEVVFGLLVLIAATSVPYLGLPELGTALAGLAFWFLGPIKSPMTTPARGYGRVGVLVVFGLAGLLAALLGGCASQNGGKLDLRLRDHATRPQPACLYRFTIDGAVLVEGEVDDCPAVPMCREVRP